MKRKARKKLAGECEICGSYLNKRINEIYNEIISDPEKCMCDVAKRIYTLEQEIEFYQKIIKVDNYLLANEEVFRNRRINSIKKQFKDANKILKRLK